MFTYLATDPLQLVYTSNDVFPTIFGSAMVWHVLLNTRRRSHLRPEVNPGRWKQNPVE